jgi:hypothetical protein
MTKEKVTDLEMLILTLGQGSSSERENWIGVDLAGGCRCHVTTVVEKHGRMFRFAVEVFVVGALNSAFSE